MIFSDHNHDIEVYQKEAELLFEIYKKIVIMDQYRFGVNFIYLKSLLRN